VIYRFPLSHAAALVLAAAFAMPIAAQSPASRISGTEGRSQALRALEQESVHKVSSQESVTAANRQQELTIRLADFANSWNKLIQNAQKGVWNAKEAKKTRKAFERLIHSEGWIEDMKDKEADR
jgi:hypothetical protein